jgi:hypothetical protein
VTTSWSLTSLSSYSNYKDLIIEIDGHRSNYTGALNLQLNGDTGNNYSFTTLSEKQDPATRIECYPMFGQLDSMIIYTITLPEWTTSTGKYKSVYVRMGATQSSRPNLITGYRKSSANITSVDFTGTDWGGYRYRIYGRS